MDGVTTALIGREVEQARLLNLLEGARQGSSGVLVLEGDPGIGKSVLLRDLVSRAEGFTVVLAVGSQSEIELPYGGFGRLLRPLAGFLGELEDNQSEMLNAVFAARGVDAGLGAENASDRYAAGAAALSLISSSAESAPLLAVIDDAQWVDHSSLGALAFVAHRLLAERIVLVLARRNNGETPELDDLPRLEIGGLEPSAAARLLEQVDAPVFDPSRGQDLARALGGNPLALLELPRLLSADELAGISPTAQPLPLGDVLLTAYSTSLSQLSDRCRRAALVLSLLTETDLKSVSTSLDFADLTMSDLIPAEDARLLRIEPDGVQFVHPLVRSAATYSVPASWRRAAHLAVSRRMDGLSNFAGRMQRAWHRAAAVVGLDEAVAASLEEMAAEAVKLTGFSAAASAYLRAGQLSVSDTDRARRLVLAADAASLAGQIPRADQCLQAVSSLPTPETSITATAAKVRIRVDLARGRLADAVRDVAYTAEGLASTHPLQAMELLMEAVAASSFKGDTDVARDFALRAVVLSESDAFAKLLAEAALGCVLLIRGETPEGLARLAPVLELPPELVVSDPASLPYVTRIAFCLAQADHFDTAVMLLSAASSRCTEVGVYTVLPFITGVQGMISFRRGQWAVARADAYTGLRLARDMSQDLEIANACWITALIECGLGNEDVCREIIAQGMEVVSKNGIAPVEAGLYYDLGQLELSLQNVDLAISALEASRQICEATGLLELGNWQWPPDLVEAYMRAGMDSAAEDVVNLLEWHAERSKSPIVQAFLGRCRGMVDTQTYERHFEEALAWHTRSNRPFELARTQFCYGERLRRGRKRAAARQQLEAAWLSFSNLGARRWVDLTRTELAAAGVSKPDSAQNSISLLTPQEAQVALAVANGATNRQAATQLFLSPKTIEYHLSRVFRKLDIASRGELTAVLATS